MTQFPVDGSRRLRFQQELLELHLAWNRPVRWKFLRPLRSSAA